jgi:MerR family transcriptional regulator/heat shock protein HspR
MTAENRDAPASGPLIFTRIVAAQLARVSVEFLDRCEAEELVQPRRLAGGEGGYAADDIERLSQIRRLHEMLGLDLDAVDVVLHLREQVLALLARLEDLEARFARREQELMDEISDLRHRLPAARERV